MNSFGDQCKYFLPVSRTHSLKFSVSQLVQLSEASDSHVSHNTKLITFREGGYYSIASSFAEWFSHYVEMLVNERYCIWEGNILLYDQCTEVSAITKYITVTVRWTNDHTFNTVMFASNLYAYHITMTMSSNAPESESCKLTTRYWEIQDVEGTHIIAGDEYHALMRSGSKFSWRSYVSFKGGNLATWR